MKVEVAAKGSPYLTVRDGFSAREAAFNSNYKLRSPVCIYEDHISTLKVL